MIKWTKFVMDLSLEFVSYLKREALNFSQRGVKVHSRCVGGDRKF